MHVICLSCFWFAIVADGLTVYHDLKPFYNFAAALQLILKRVMESALVVEMQLDALKD